MAANAIEEPWNRSLEGLNRLRGGRATAVSYSERK